MRNPGHGVWPQGLPRELTRPERSVFENLLATAERMPERPAVWFYGATLTYGELLEQVRRLSAYLHRDCGIRPDDRVVLYMQNSPQYIIGYYAALAANAVVVPASPMSRGPELLHLLRDSDARAILYGEELGGEVEAAARGHGVFAMVSARYGDYAAPESGYEMPAELSRPAEASAGARWDEALSSAWPPPKHDRGPDSWCAIPYSSGTTGRPKGCLHTHASVNAVIFAYPGWVGMREGSRVLATLPLCHVTGMQNSMNAPLLVGATIYLVSRWNAELASRIIERERIEHWRSITTMMIDFLSIPGIEKRDFSSLKAVGGGGAQMPMDVAEKMADLIGLDYVEAYGLTETMAATHINPPSAPKAQCMGIPIHDVDSRVVDPDTLEELGPNRTGEIVLEAPQVFKGYWRRPEETEAAFLEIAGKRFLRTGDIGRYDDEGYFYFVERLKRMINVGGLKVWPAEVEAVLHGHPCIAEVCVVADPDPRTGEAVRAVVVMRDDAGAATPKELAAWCRQRMAAYKTPRRFEFRESLPRTAIGKVLWKELMSREIRSRDES